MIKFDCTKVSGKVDYVKVVNQMSKGVRANVSLDGHVIPNMQMETEFFEELDAGDQVTLYTIFKNSKQRDKNFGVLYGLKKSDGKKAFATQYRWQVPLTLAVYAVIAFCVVFVIGWPVTVALLRFSGLFMPSMTEVTTIALVEASLAGGFFLWGAWKMINCTADAEAWKTMDPASLSGRFSKLYK
ncbi:hypothetical protein GN299_26520 [Pseudomonas putida]|uniref:Uncharacterized protein n=2 Tax=Pseudomonas TaxID=286 RepID=A0A7V8J1W9_PSEPU|nr:hypothetical protein GN299_26520 [Pseudomonas putida]